ncbi:response regulator [Prosthecobacter sp.]|uniref:response regulator n=1 Tax=Prosthecobacter sp. TaxID=1965333 RepID=UPI00248A25F4|nr:response regulator [Prosthecobacter sp.]MDI1312091.1 response regulator [Prosthecobacter sp.]
MEPEPTPIKSILLVDDDPRDVELTLAALEGHHLANKVFVVQDGAEALDYLFRRGKFENRDGGDPIFVLLDNSMPKVSGLEVLTAMKADPHLKMIPVVALTSSSETPDLHEFYQQGVNSYVVKPVMFDDFMKVVQQLGVFWAAVNEPPPAAAIPEPSEKEVIYLGKKEVKNEFSSSHPAS